MQLAARNVRTVVVISWPLGSIVLAQQFLNCDHAWAGQLLRSWVTWSCVLHGFVQALVLRSTPADVPGLIGFEVGIAADSNGFLF